MSADLSPEERTAEGDTALTLAAAAGLGGNVGILLGEGASPHSTNGRNESPLLIGTHNTDSSTGRGKNTALGDAPPTPPG